MGQSSTDMRKTMLKKECHFVIVVLVTILVKSGLADLPTFYLDTELCNQFINMSDYNSADLPSFRLKLSKDHFYPHNLDCALRIRAERDSEHIMFYFLKFDIRPVMWPEYCSYDWLDVRDGNSTDSPYACGIDHKLCGISPSRTKGVYVTCSNCLTLYFSSGRGERYTGFDMVITRYRYGTCSSDEVECDNGRCIDQSLPCNRYNPCGDKSDCPRHSVSFYLAIVFGAVAFLSMVIFAVVCFSWKQGHVVIKRKLDKEKTPIKQTGQINSSYNSIPTELKQHSQQNTGNKTNDSDAETAQGDDKQSLINKKTIQKENILQDQQSPPKKDDDKQRSLDKTTRRKENILQDQQSPPKKDDDKQMSLDKTTRQKENIKQDQQSPNKPRGKIPIHFDT